MLAFTLKEVYQINIDRRALQFYSSPKLKLIPLPTYRGGHVAYYRKSSVIRVGVIKNLQKNLGLSLTQIKALFEVVPEEYIFLLMLSFVKRIVDPILFLILEGIRTRSITRDNIKKIIDNPISAIIRKTTADMVLDKYAAVFLVYRRRDEKKFAESVKKIPPKITKELSLELTKTIKTFSNKQFENTLEKIIEADVVEALKKGVPYSFISLKEKLHKLIYSY